MNIELRARDGFPREICGFLWGRRERGQLVITDHIPMRNISSDLNKFLIDPEAHLTLLRQLRQEGQEKHLLGSYHSHPSGNPKPSGYDIPDQAKQLWLIFALRHPTACLRIGAWWSRDKNQHPPFLKTILRDSSHLRKRNPLLLERFSCR